MNYALDALWWRLKNPQVRALASLLTAPSLWQTPHVLSVRELLGEQGFRLLLNWDEQINLLPTPQPNERLGRYAERLLQFWFSHAPHSTLIAHSLPISDQQRTLGELDFIVEINKRLIHLEFCCKYYGGETPEQSIGLNKQDSLQDKINKLNQQLALPHTPAAQNALKQLGIDSKKLSSLSLTRGILFLPNAKLPEKSHFQPNTWLGHLGLPSQINAEQRFYVLPKQHYLAPARIATEHTLSHSALTNAPAALIAQVQQRDDGMWHETARYMHFFHKIR